MRPIRTLAILALLAVSAVGCFVCAYIYYDALSDAAPAHVVATR